MQDKTIIECINLSIPLDLFDEAGIEPDGVLEMHVSNGKIIISVPDSTENFACDGNCNECPIHRASLKRNRKLNVRCKNL